MALAPNIFPLLAKTWRIYHGVPSWEKPSEIPELRFPRIKLNLEFFKINDLLGKRQDVKYFRFQTSFKKFIQDF
jgi:hypothetical protein